MNCEECTKFGRIGNRITEVHGEFILHGCDNPICSQFFKWTNSEKVFLNSFVSPIREKSLEERIKELELKVG